MKNILLEISKTLVNAILIITAVYSIRSLFMQSPFGELPVMQIVGALQILLVIGYDIYSRVNTKPKKK